MFEILMLTALLCAGFCHLMPEEHDAEAAELPRAEERSATARARRIGKKTTPAGADHRKEKAAACG